MKQTIESRPHKGQSAVIKILCLAAGLTLGLVLLAKVYFIESYNSCIPDRERIATVQERGKFLNDAGRDFVSNHIPGGMAPSMADEMPEVEAATRMTMLNGRQGEKIKVGEHEFNAQIYLADTCFFDVFRLPILVGDPKEILSHPGHTMVSRSFAQKLGGIGEALGKTFYIANDPQTLYTVGGIFEDLPENCSLEFDALASIYRQEEWSLTNWYGNEQYTAFVKLLHDITAEDAQKTLNELTRNHLDPAMLEKLGVEVNYEIVTLDELLARDSSMQNLKLLMLFMGLALIAIAVLNYMVMVVSTLVCRVKEIAVYKCYGASFGLFLGMTFRESLMHMLLALAFGALLVFSIRDTAETLLAASMSALFTLRTCGILLVVCLALLAVTSIVPACIFSRVPVAAAFRSARESKRTWKLALLFVQLVATSLIVCLLVCITRQYQRMAHIDFGYSYDRLLVVRTYGVDDDVRNRMMQELERFPQVEMVTGCCQLPHYGESPNTVLAEDWEQELFAFSDMYCITDNYFETMEVPLIDGEMFERCAANDYRIIVSREFARKLRTVMGWEGSVVGQQVTVGEHCQPSSGERYTIVGVCEDFRLGSGRNSAVMPMAFFPVEPYSWARPYHILLKMHHITPAGTQKVNEYLASAVPGRHLEAVPLSAMMLKRLNNEKNIRDSLIICAVVALIIALVGLVGYTTDEVNRRRKEIAIRRVMGTSSQAVLRILSRDVTLIALPALTVGAAIAFSLVEDWLQDYTERITLDVFTFLLPTLFIYLHILCCVLLRAYRVASESPARNLRSE